MDILLKIATTILAPFLFIGASLGTMIAPEPVAPLGASQEIPTTIAFFETTLASAINETATTFTLTSAVDKDGTTLASSTYAFVIDEGSSNEEIVLADCTATACINAERGVSARTGNTEVTALKKSHRRGSSVKMTDAPLLPLVARILRGEGEVDFTPSTGGSLVTKDYVDALSFGGTVPVASLTDDGVAELSTGLEAASSTPTGGSGSPLMLHTGISTSTGGTAYTIPVTGSDGALDTAFTNGVEIELFTASSTWTKPEGAYLVEVIAIGGGGGGGGGARDATGNNAGGGSGGGGGGYSRLLIPASVLGATTSVTVGAGGSGGAGATVNDTDGVVGIRGATSTFGTYISATGGGAGSYGPANQGVASTSAGGYGASPASTNGTTGGAGGTISGATAVAGGATTIQVPTGGGGGTYDGNNGSPVGGIGGTISSTMTIAGGTATANSAGGNGTSITTGFINVGTGGGGGSTNASGVGQNGGNGGIYGGGGGGGSGGENANGGNGGNGANGAVWVITYF